MSKLIITAALTGEFHGKEANPNLPITPDEIAQSAFECWQAGAAIVHLHARDQNGKPTCDPQVYGEIVAKVKARCNAVTQVSTGAGPELSPDERIKAIDAGAEMGSLNMGTMVRTRWGENSFFLNARPQIEAYAKKMLEKGMKPEMEVYGHSMMVDVENLISKHLLKKPYYVDCQAMRAVQKTAETVLLVIDMQKVRFSRSRRLFRQARNAGADLAADDRGDEDAARQPAGAVRVVYTVQLYEPDGSDDVMVIHRIKPAALARSNGEIPVRRGGWGAEIVPELAPRSDDVVIAKRRFDAFYQTDLEALLRRWGIKTVLFAGVVGNVCVETSLRSAFVRDFDVVLARDCVADWSTHDTQRTAEVVERSFGACLSNAQIACMLSSAVGA